MYSLIPVYIGKWRSINIYHTPKEFLEHFLSMMKSMELHSIKEQNHLRAAMLTMGAVKIAYRSFSEVEDLWQL